MDDPYTPEESREARISRVSMARTMERSREVREVAEDILRKTSALHESLQYMLNLPVWSDVVRLPPEGDGD